MKDFTKYDVLDYLEIDVRLVTSILDRVIKDYWTKRNEQMVEEVHTAFDAIRRHLERQESIMKLVEHEEILRSAYAKFEAYKDQIGDLMDDMALEHVDDESFLSDLVLLRSLVGKLGRLESRRLFAKLREEMSDEVKDKSDEIMHSGFSKSSSGTWSTSK